MSDNFITSSQIQKLGHKILEIRQRALLNIISKLEHGFIYDNELARSKEILSKLFEWFLYSPCTHEELVFDLIKQTLQTESGQTLLRHYGSNIITKELQQIKTYVEPKFYNKVDDLLKLVEDYKVVVPPLECDIPLSYRSEQNSIRRSKNVGTTATTILGYVHKDSSLDPKNGLEAGYTPLATYTLPNYTHESQNCNKSVVINNKFNMNYILSWQPLIEADRHVLKSVETSLRKPPHPSALLHSCEFFTDVLLHDFPAEVFLQRPTIVLHFQNLIITCPSTRVTNAVFICLLNLTKALQVRLNHSRDPSMYNTKSLNFSAENSECNSPSSCGSKKTAESYNGSSSKSSASVEFDKSGDFEAIRNQQLSIPRYCFSTVQFVFKYLCVKPESIRESNRRNLNQVGINIALNLLQELLNLLSMIINPDVWNKPSDPINCEIIRGITETLVQYGDSLEYFRLEASSNDSILNYRAVQLFVLANCTCLLNTFVPLEKCYSILPQNLKSELSNHLVDFTIARLFPKVHNTMLDYVKCFTESYDKNCMRKYVEVENICKGMTAAVELLNSYKTLSTHQIISLIKVSLISLEFHKELKLLKIFVETCANKLPFKLSDEDLFKTAEDVTLSLLSHKDELIKEEMYSLCHKRIIAAIGPKLNISGTGVPGSQILFLLRSRVLIEIASFGVTSANAMIERYAEDVLLHVIKCKILVSEDIWNKCLEALMPAFPILLCHCDRNSSLGRTIINIFDPDTAKELLIPSIEIIKGNIELLFSFNSQTRTEAFSRICWLLSSQKDSRDLLPRLNNLQDKALLNVCQGKTVLDINKVRAAQHFYQPSSLQQVLELLNSSNVEPVIRRSALTQISVMLEDPILHQTFIHGDGIKTVLKIMKVALIEDDFREYPDSIIPAISILKNLSLHTPFARQCLYNNIDVYYCGLRGLFLFFTEEKLKQDASNLLFILIFHNFCLGSPSKSSFSIPQLISDKLRVPFTCINHWNVSPHSSDSLIPLITSDKWCLSSIQVQWNSEILGGITELIKQNVLKPNDKINDLLTLKTYDFLCLKFSAIDYCVEKYLAEIQIEESHHGVVDLINKLINYIGLYSMLQEYNLLEDKSSLILHDWENTFKKYLKTLPSSEEDVQLLTTTINMLVLLVPMYKKSEEQCWINALLKDPCLCILDVMHVDSTTNEETKSLSRKLLKLITLCVCQEQHYLDLYPQPSLVESKQNKDNHCWYNVIEIISDSLKFSDTQHFYNLAYLDSLLSCLVHLTATLGWSGCKSGSLPKKQLKQLVGGLCELVGAFHCGKGSSAAVSVMGLSITRHVLLILNHLLAEMQNCNVKNWELCFIELQNGYSLKSFLTLLSSRDVVLRAAALQLFAGLTVSPRASIEMVHEIFNEKQSIWEVTLGIVTDHEEASIVRENAAAVLANLASHTTLSPNDKMVIISGVVPLKNNKNLSSTGLLLTLLEDYHFFKNLELILTSLYTNKLINIISQDSNNSTPIFCLVNETKNNIKNSHSFSDASWNSSTNSDDFNSITTPSFVKSVTVFLLNILVLAEEQISNSLQDLGLIKLLFRCLCNPCISVNNTKQLSLYCDLLEMNSAICSFLSRVVICNSSCLGTILHTRDCLNVFLSLLNPKIYHVHLPQLIYLRNKLWTEIFRLLGALLDTGNEFQGNRCLEALNILSDTLVESGQQPFLEALCEAIGSIGSSDLQTSALSSLTSLLKIETSRFSDTDSDKNTFCSMQSFLDTVSTPRTKYVEDYYKENEENIEPNNALQIYNYNSINLLENVYFEPVLQLKTKKFTHTPKNDDEPLKAGAELCKILLYLYDLSNVKISNEIFNAKKKSIIIATLSSVLCVSQEAKNYALQHNLLDLAMKQLKDCHIKLSLESVDCIRRVSDKRRVHPVLKETNEICGLFTNFMIDNDSVKQELTLLGFADLVHKLWVWFLIQKPYLIDALKMLCTFTTNCCTACHSMPFTSSVAGAGPRKVPSNISLLHAIVALIGKEMDQVSRSHDLLPLQLCLQILHNCCSILECRTLLTKSNLLQSVSRLHPALTKRQKPWDNVEQLWLEFLENFTLYPEGQAAVAKITDILDLILTLTSSTKVTNRYTALLVVRNLAFYQPNRPRLLTSGEFLNTLRLKLTNGTIEEKDVVISVVWALAANNQKAKLVLKSAQIDLKIQDALKQYLLINENNESLEKMSYVLSILKENEKSR